MKNLYSFDKLFWDNFQDASFNFQFKVRDTCGEQNFTLYLWARAERKEFLCG